MPELATNNVNAKARQPSRSIFKPRLMIFILIVWLVAACALLAFEVHSAVLTNDLVTLVAATGLVLAGLWAREGRLERKRAKLVTLHCCPSCGYSLLGLTGDAPWPECGKRAGTS